MNRKQLNLGSDLPVVVVAEIGVNHDGRVERAMELVSAARGAGADGVKLQVFRSATLVHGEGILAEYQKSTTDAGSSADLLRRCELGEAELGRVLGYARSLGMLTVATPFSPSDVAVCGRLGLDAIKIASPDVVNHILLGEAARAGLPLLVSTGAATLEEVVETDGFLGALGVRAHYLHCVSAYPAPDGLAHLAFIRDLIGRFGERVGYSDHAPSLLAGACAVAAGAVLLERHLTYDTAAVGPDHAASSDPGQFAEYVRMARLAETLRGKGHKRLLDVEGDVRRVSRQSLVLALPLERGEALTAGHLTTQRPGTGIPPNLAGRFVSRRAKQSLPVGTMLTPEHFLP